MTIYLFRKVCTRCHKPKAVKGGKQDGRGKRFVCGECK